jgi:hypothetical protein
MVDTQQAVRAGAEYREQLDTLEEALRAELDKPTVTRQLEPLLERYRTLADQQANAYVATYAQARVRQIESAVETVDGLQRVRALADEVATTRRTHMEERSRLRPIPAVILRGFDAEGELRESMIWSDWTGPKRYRLVDPQRDLPRTLCYVEIPDDAKIDISEFLGRTVGIWARHRYLQGGEVDLIPIVVADRMVALDQPAPIVYPDEAEPASADSGQTALEAVEVEVD